MKKKFLLSLFAAFLNIFIFCMLSTSAETPGQLSYSASGGKVTITDCDESATEIVIPETINGCPVTAIGSYAFEGCSVLARIDIPDSVVSIGKRAFSSCTRLTSITLPDSIEYIDEYAFSQCSGLVHIDLSANLSVLSSNVFYKCTSLPKISIPASVTYVGDSAFYGCSALTGVYIEDLAAWCNIRFVNNLSNPLYYAKNLYLNGSQVTYLSIPDGVTSIGSNAFVMCENIKKIKIPDSVRSIGAYSFYYCSGISSIDIPNSVTSIEAYAFLGCSNLARVDIPNSVTYCANSAFSHCTSLAILTIGSGMTQIPTSAFYNCKSLKYVCLPRDMLYIGSNAFGGDEVSGPCPIEIVFYAGNSSNWSSMSISSYNESLKNAKIVYGAQKRTYKFNTQNQGSISDVTDYAVFSAPTIWSDDKILTGWYDNENHSGEPITFPYYGSATTLYASWTARTGSSFDYAFVAKENITYPVTTTQSVQRIYFEFTPKVSGEYRFYSTGIYDTYCHLYNSKREVLTYDDDDGDGYNFNISYKMQAGQTYYLSFYVRSGTGTFNLVCETLSSAGVTAYCVTANSGEKIVIASPQHLPEDARVMVAFYKDGKFIEIQSAPNNNAPLYFIAKSAFDSAKVMLWETPCSLKPLCDYKSVR